MRRDAERTVARLKLDELDESSREHHAYDYVWQPNEDESPQVASINIGEWHGVEVRRGGAPSETVAEALSKAATRRTREDRDDPLFFTLRPARLGVSGFVMEDDSALTSVRSDG